MIHNGIELTEVKLSNKRRVVLLWGPAKQGGKTTFAMTAPGPILDLQYDLGSPTIPPGVDPQSVTYKTYPPAELAVRTDTDRWAAPQNVGREILNDLLEVRQAFMEQRPIKIDGTEIQLPRTLILDGMVSYGDHQLDWMLGVNNAKDPSDFSNPFELWGRRKTITTRMFNMVFPLPCNVVIITWETNATKTEKDKSGRQTIVQLPQLQPDIGGKMDILTPGKADASLYCYSQKIGDSTKYRVKTRGNEIIQGCGVRGIYTLLDDIDVTIDPKKPHPLPWEKIFGQGSRS